jgi:3-dehydroquinate synthase
MDFQNQFDNFINKNFEADITKIIAKNIEYKLSVVTKDPFEEFGKRKILNYGHTFGHALETYMDFKF